MARIEMEVKLKSGEIKRQLRRLEFRDDLFVESGELDEYRGFTVSQIDAVNDTVEFTNGVVLQAGEASGDVSERDIRRIQVRETIKAHLDKEKPLFAQGIKVLSPFFIDEVVKYRDYDEADTNGEYARVADERRLEALRSAGGLGAFLRSLLGLDRRAAKEACSAVLDLGSMTASQLQFIDLILNYLTERGAGAGSGERFREGKWRSKKNWGRTVSGAYANDFV